MKRKHIHEEIFENSREEVFRLLITPSLICKWWGAARAIVMPEEGGIWIAAWGEDEDSPDYVSGFTMSVFDPPNRILFTDSRYTAGGEKLPFEAVITAEFIVSENERGCSLKVIQDGFPADPEADDFYAACEKGWKDTFAGIRKTLSG